MAQTIQEFIQSGDDLQIGTADPKTKIAPLTRNGKPIYITLAKTPTLSTPFSPWPSYDNGERTSLDLRTTPELEQLAEHIDELIQKQVLADRRNFMRGHPRAWPTTTTRCIGRPPSRGTLGPFVPSALSGRRVRAFGPSTLRRVRLSP